MVLSLSKDALFDYVKAQLNHFFPDQYRFQGRDADAAFSTALERTEECLKVILLPNYHDVKGNTLFSHLHSDQYATFLYFLGNSLWRQSENKPLCDKLLQLNRVLFSVFISYKCGLPDHFLLAHPVGTILGNAKYSDFLVVFQGVTVNSYEKEGGPPPQLGKGLFLGAHSQILGNEPVGDYVSIGSGTTVFRQAVPDNSLVVAKNGTVIITPQEKQTCSAQLCFNVSI